MALVKKDPEMEQPSGGGAGTGAPRCAAQDELLRDASVKKGMKEAAARSDMGGSNPKENGGLILKDPVTAALSVEPWPQGSGNRMTVPVHDSGKCNGKDIVGSFHTHPNAGIDPVTGNAWQESPSSGDIQNVTKHPAAFGTHYVIGVQHVYAIDPRTGAVSTVGKTSDMLG